MAIMSTTTKAEFEEKVLKSKKVVLVDFWAQWCPPCRAMAPVLEMTARHMEDGVDIVKVDIEATPDNNQLATEYRIQSIPNMKVFKGGEVVEEIIGMRPQPAIEGTLKKHLG